jgi:hypothetical protein
VIADLAALLDDHDGQLGVRGFRELLQPDRSGERRRPGADEEHIDFEGIALWHDPPRFADEGSGSRACETRDVDEDRARIIRQTFTR